jgi:hypothetical protein
VKMTISKLSYQLSRSLPYNDKGKKGLIARHQRAQKGANQAQRQAIPRQTGTEKTSAEGQYNGILTFGEESSASKSRYLCITMLPPSIG